MGYVFKEGEQILHFIKECEECKHMEYKGVKIEHFLALGDGAYPIITVEVKRHFGEKIKITVILSKVTLDNKVIELGRDHMIQELKNFYHKFGYDEKGWFNRTMLKRNNNLIFKFIRMKVNQIAQRYDKLAIGTYKINSLGNYKPEKLTHGAMRR